MKYMGWSRADLDCANPEDYEVALQLFQEEQEEIAKHQSRD